MEKLNRRIFWTVAASESIHIFCCVLPSLFSILSLLAGIGFVSVLPGAVFTAHHMLHMYEVPMIIFSGMILTAGWGLYAYGQKINCRTQGDCCHTPCESKKDKTRLLMMIATVLFAVNLSVYFIFHRSADENFSSAAIHAMDEHDDKEAIPHS